MLVAAAVVIEYLKEHPRVVCEEEEEEDEWRS
jgi:hypothetical protein